MSGASYGSPFVDQPAILDGELLYRRISPKWIDWDVLDDAGNPRIRRAAFQDYQLKKAMELGYPAACMSIGLSSVLSANSSAAESLIDGYEGYGLASIRAGEVRERQQGVMAWATEKEPWHGVVFSKVGPKRTERMEIDLASMAEWIVVPAPQ